MAATAAGIEEFFEGSDSLSTISATSASVTCALFSVGPNHVSVVLHAHVCYFFELTSSFQHELIRDDHRRINAMQ